MPLSKRGSCRLLLYTGICALLLSILSAPVLAATPDMPVPASGSAILTEAATSQVLRESRSDVSASPYGAVNLLIAMTALRHASLQDSVVVPEDIKSAIPDEAFIIYLEEGEKLTVENCIGAILFNSANDAAYTLAVALAGSVDAFAKWMNETAADCGADQSHFSSVLDIQAPEQYTTARDMSRIAAEFWKTDALRQLLSQELYSIPPTNKTSETRYYANPFKMLAMGTSSYYQYALGGKSSRNTIIAFADNTKMSLISVVLDVKDADEAYETAAEILQYGFEYFQPVEIEYSGSSIARIPVYEGENKIGYADAAVKGTFTFYAEVLSRKPTDPEGLESFFSHTLNLPERLQAPVQEGDKLGEVVYSKLDDPTVQIRLDCVALETLKATDDARKDGAATPGSLAKYIGWLNLVLIPAALYLAWRLLWPLIEKKRRRPKSF